MTAPANAAKVRVHVPFPRIDQNEMPDFQSETWDWILCLEIPVNLLNDHYFSVKPYKWIRYATGVVVGAHGHLSRKAEQFDKPDYNDALLEHNTGDLYYHLDDGERQGMFPTDPRLAGVSTTSSDATSWRPALRDDLIERDNTCVLTNQTKRVCDEVPLIAHSKGDQYISTFTSSRSRDPQDRISSTDNLRNVLLLNVLTHVGFGKDVAFLVTPNFAMDTIDVVENAPPGVARCTAYLFPPADPTFLSYIESGHAVRVASRDWPSDILFDAVYASAVMEHFSAPGFKATSTRIWKNHFYLEDEQTLARQKLEYKQQQRRDRDQARAHREPDNFDYS